MWTARLSSRPYRTRGQSGSGFPGFHPGLFSRRPSGTRACLASNEFCAASRVPKCEGPGTPGNSEMWTAGLSSRPYRTRGQSGCGYAGFHPGLLRK
jgi:hypothetical protein